MTTPNRSAGQRARQRAAGATLILGVALGLAGCVDAEAPPVSTSSAADVPPEPPPVLVDEPVEVWRTPGVFLGTTPDETRVLGHDSESQAAALYEVTSGEEVWSGTCDGAFLLGDSVVCGNQLIDPDTGSAVAFPDGTQRPIGGDGEHVAMVSGSQIVGYDAQMTELWQRAGAPTDGEVLIASRAVPFVPPGETGENEFSWHHLDVVTGAVISEDGEVTALADGYVVTGADLGVTGYSWDGTQLWSRDGRVVLPFVRQEFDTRMNVEDYDPAGPAADAYAAAEEVGGIVEGLWLGDTPVIFVAGGNGTFSVDGVTYNGNALWARGWGDGAYLVAIGVQPQGVTSTLYRTGSPDPIWTIDGGLSIELQGSIVTWTTEDVIVYAPAG